MYGLNIYGRRECKQQVISTVAHPSHSLLVAHTLPTPAIVVVLVGTETFASLGLSQGRLGEDAEVKAPPHSAGIILPRVVEVVVDGDRRLLVAGS